MHRVRFNARYSYINAIIRLASLFYDVHSSNLFIFVLFISSAISHFFNAHVDAGVDDNGAALKESMTSQELELQARPMYLINIK